MAWSGVRSSWLIVARKRDFARLAPSALRRASSELSLACSSSAIKASFSSWKEKPREFGSVQHVGQNHQTEENGGAQQRKRRGQLRRRRPEDEQHRGHHRQQ